MTFHDWLEEQTDNQVEVFYALDMRAAWNAALEEAAKSLSLMEGFCSPSDIRDFKEDE